MSELDCFWGTAMGDVVFPEGTVSREDTFYILAAAAGISTPEGMYKYYLEHPGPDGINGVDWMIGRLGLVINLTQHIWARSQELNKNLHEQLTTPIRREEDAGEYEIGRVPQKYFDEISPVSTPTGWSAPRLLILLSEKRPTSDASEMLDRSIVESTDPAMFLCLLAEKIYSTGVQASEIIELVLKHHKMKEEGNPKMYFAVINSLQVNAPKLWQEVTKLYETEKGKAKPSGWTKIISLYENQEE